MTADQHELRHRLVHELLTAGEPVPLERLIARCAEQAPAEAVTALLADLALEHQALRVRLGAEPGSIGYCWWAVWERHLAARTAAAAEAVRRRVEVAGPAPAGRPDIESPVARAFHAGVLGDHRPPEDKALLVLLQCSVRRPFSTSPSHASMRRAIAAATGCDPRHDFVACPVHVVVVASYLGPVPYELEELYPANVGSAGVQQASPGEYDRLRPVLAERLADYLTVHGAHYEQITTFTGGRYGEVVREAQRLAKVAFAVLPDESGPEVRHLGRSRPRTYWQRYWIQLTLQLVEWLGPAWQAAAEERLREWQVDWRD